MPKTSNLRFHNYSVTELSYKQHKIPEGTHDFHLNPHIVQNIEKLGDNLYDLSLNLEIIPDDVNISPFELRVAIVGHFSFEETDQAISEADEQFRNMLLNQNGAAILFPFLRSIVANLTVNANIPVLMLPVMNFMGNNPEN